MTTANDIIKASLNYIGAHSEVLPVSPGVLTASVQELSDMLSELAADEIVLGEDITLPVNSSTDILEPAGATSSLKYLLCEKLAPLVRLDTPPDVMRNINKSRQKLYRMYRVSTVPNIVPSRLAPRGASKGQRNTFFKGSALDDDSSTTT